MRRLASKRLLFGATSGTRTIRIAEAVHGRDYTGRVLRVTDYHVLQDLGDDCVLHDRQLAATVRCQPNEIQTVSYRYQYGKIVPVDSPTPTPNVIQRRNKTYTTTSISGCRRE